MADIYDEWSNLVNKANNYVANYNPNEQINMQDARLTNVETERQNEIRSTTDQYNSMINNADQFYDRQAQVARENAQRQQELQNASTEQQVKEINQQREKTERDYQKEQRGAYTDYQKQVNEYGVNAEIMASRGLAGTGYAESSQVSMYNAYQNRVAMARQSLADSQQNYDNLIAQARLNNDTRQAEIANELAKAQAEYALQGFQYKNSLIESRQQQLNQLNSRYDTRYNTMLGVMENELQAKRQNFNTYSGVIQANKEMIQDINKFNQEMEMKDRQWKAEMEMKDRQFKAQQAQWEKEYQLERQKLQASISSSNSKKYNIDPYSGGNESTGEVVRADAKVKTLTPEEIGQRITVNYNWLGLPDGIKDKTTGKVFRDTKDFENYMVNQYGYVIVD